MKRLDITDDDSKVLGKTPVRFLSQSAEQFSSKKYMTHHSAWTPVNHKPSNEQVMVESSQPTCYLPATALLKQCVCLCVCLSVYLQIYKERRELISHWVRSLVTFYQIVIKGT